MTPAQETYNKNFQELINILAKYVDFDVLTHYDDMILEPSIINRFIEAEYSDDLNKVVREHLENNFKFKEIVDKMTMINDLITFSSLGMEPVVPVISLLKNVDELIDQDFYHYWDSVGEFILERQDDIFLRIRDVIINYVNEIRHMWKNILDVSLRDINRDLRPEKLHML